MYYIEKENKIVLADADLEKINSTLPFIPDLQNSEIQETEREIINLDGEYRFKDEVEDVLQQKERERLNLLSLTKREVFLALYKSKGITPEMVRASITDSEALIEFDYANEYFRGNPLINALGVQLGFSSEDLDYLFEHKELPIKEEEEINGTGETSNISSNPPVDSDEVEE